MAKRTTSIALGATLLMAASSAAAQLSANSTRPVDAGTRDERAAPVFDLSIYEPDPAPALGPAPASEAAPPQADDAAMQREAGAAPAPHAGAEQAAAASAAEQTQAQALPGAARESLPLGPAADASGDPRSGVGGAAALARMTMALVAVIGLIFILWFVFRRFSGTGSGLTGQLGAGGKAPSGLLTVLGRYPVARGQTLVVLKLDRRILLLNQNSAGFRTLCDINDPDEVASILVKSRDEEGESMASRFRTLLKSVERDESVAGSDATIGPTTPRGAWMNDDDVYTEPEQYEEAPEDDAAGALGSLRRRLESLRGMSA